MCCDTTMCERAKRKLSVRFCRVLASRRGTRQHDIAARGIKSAGVMWSSVDDVSAQLRRPMQASESGAAVRTAWGSRPRRGAGFTSIQ